MKHLMAISIGPVQDFIAAARRTADLQAGSELLVGVAKTLAKTLAEQGAVLIFPAPPPDDDFSKLLDGPNKLLVETLDGIDPRDLAKRAKDAAEEHIKSAWETAQKIIKEKRGNVLLEDLAEKQVKTFLEFYAAWLPLKEGEYAETRCKVERLLAGRKALRDFAQPESPTGRPKSPLDPSRDCVLKPKEGGQGEDAFRVDSACAGYPLRLKPTETLDAISLLKRVNGVCNAASGTPSTSEMAARAVTSIQKEDLGHDADAVRDAVAKLKASLGAMKAQLDVGIDLGDLMFPSRLQDELALLNRQEMIKSGERTIEKYLQEQLPVIETQRLAVLAAANARGKECPPYYAILAADGDRMGKLLTELKKVDEHVQFSRTLSEFAAWAQECVRKHDGHPVYTGGDDVLAFVPVQNAIACAAELAKAFERRMSEIRQMIDGSANGAANAQGENKEEKAGTLSVGIAIVHFMDSLQICVERARQAEHVAKKTRNALAVALHTRGGEAMTVSDSWEDAPGTQWSNLMKAMRDELGRGFPYELRELAREWRGVELDGERLSGEGLADRLQNEALRVLKRKKGGKEGEDAPVIKLLRPLLEKAQTPADLERLAKKLVIARFLTADIPAAPTAAATPAQASDAPDLTPSAPENHKETAHA